MQRNIVKTAWIGGTIQGIALGSPESFVPDRKRENSVKPATIPIEAMKRA
jgi:hypothetical protein